MYNFALKQKLEIILVMHYVGWFKKTNQIKFMFDTFIVEKKLILSYMSFVWF